MTKPGADRQVIVRYTTDGGTTFTIDQKKTNAEAIGNIIVPFHTPFGRQERGRLREVEIVTWLVDIHGNPKVYRRTIAIGDRFNPYFTGQLTVVYIEGVAWRVMRRIGERPLPA